MLGFLDLVVWNLAHCARGVASNRHLDLANDAGTLSRYRQTSSQSSNKVDQTGNLKMSIVRERKTRETSPLVFLETECLMVISPQAFLTDP